MKDQKETVLFLGKKYSTDTCLISRQAPAPYFGTTCLLKQGSTCLARYGDLPADDYKHLLTQVRNNLPFLVSFLVTFLWLPVWVPALPTTGHIH